MENALLLEWMSPPADSNGRLCDRDVRKSRRKDRTSVSGGRTHALIDEEISRPAAKPSEEKVRLQDFVSAFPSIFLASRAIGENIELAVLSLTI